MAATILLIAIGIFAIGMLAGIIAAVSIGVNREDRGFLREIGPDNLTRGARRFTGLYVKDETHTRNGYHLLV